MKKFGKERPNTRREFLKRSLGVAAGASVGAVVVANAACGIPGPTGRGEHGEKPVEGPADAVPGGGKEPPSSEQTPAQDSLNKPKSAYIPITTVSQRIVGLLPERLQPPHKKAKWGITKLAAGESHLVHSGVKPLADGSSALGAPVSLLTFVGLTDIHILDEESPARTVELNGIAQSAWHRQECYSTQLLDAMVRKIVSLNKFSPVDFVMVTGDVIDNCQLNELEWFFQVMNGGPVRPNSGQLEDPRPGPNNDPHDDFVAAGLGGIPWYGTVGNHDGLVQGNFTVSEKTGYSSFTGDPTRDEVRLLDPSRTNPPHCEPVPANEASAPERCTPLLPRDLKRGKLPPDAKRRHLYREEFLARHVADGGHGFSQNNVKAKKGDYWLDPVPGMPIRLIVMDTCAKGGALGEYSKEQLDGFLKPALKKAQDQDRLVVLVSHHPSAYIVGRTLQLRNILHDHPNVLIHLVGHHHANKVVGREGKTPEAGYWEVQSSSLAEWPLQSRFFEIIDKRDGTVELWLTMVDFDTDYPGGKLVEAARFFALYETQAGEAVFHNTAGKPTDRNVILPVTLTSRMRVQLNGIQGRKPVSNRF
jgi:hypothetical protein